MVRTPKKKACAESCKVPLFPAPWNTVITVKFSFRALRPAAVQLSTQMGTPPGRLGGIGTAAPRPGSSRRRAPDARPGRAPPRGPNGSRKHCPVPPQADRRTPRFFTSFPGAGSRTDLPQVLSGPFSLAVRNRFFLGPSKKKWVREPAVPKHSFYKPPFSTAPHQKKTPTARLRWARIQAEVCSGVSRVSIPPHRQR